MTGFVDGTANPPIRDAAEVALVPEGEPGEGWSHVIAMRWIPHGEGVPHWVEDDFRAYLRCGILATACPATARPRRRAVPRVRHQDPGAGGALRQGFYIYVVA
jgi:hypothetical protein